MQGSTPKNNVVSLSGAPIYQHDAPGAWQPVQGEMCLEQISAHIERHLGPVSSVFHEIVSDTVHLDVHVVPATPDHPCVRLVTSGMSDLPMQIPEGSGQPAYMELMLSLPATWPLDEDSLKDERHYWPVRLLKTLARFPHKHATWFGYGHSLAHADPAAAYAADVKFEGAIILPPLSADEGFWQLTIDDEKTIQFMSVVPLYPEEMALKLREGSDTLLDRFDQKGITDLIDSHRPNVARKKFLGLF